MNFRKIWFALLFLFPLFMQGQTYLGLNGGSLLGRTADVYFFYHPKNQDWLALSVSGGYTLKGPLFLPHNYGPLSRYRHGGYHIRLGARNFITDDHLSNHLFWGAHVNYAGVSESATAPGGDEINQKFGSFGLQFDAGYSICLNPQSITDKWKLDLGLQLGFPVTNKYRFLGAERGDENGAAGYVPGLGYGRVGEEAVNLNLIVVMRYMLWDGRYGHYKHRKTKYKKSPDRMRKRKKNKQPERIAPPLGDDIENKKRLFRRKDEDEKEEKKEKQNNSEEENSVDET